MSYTIEFDAAHNRIVVLVAPPIGEYEAIACFREIRAHSEFRAGYGILINLLAADRALDVTEAEHIGGAISYHFPGHRIALLRRTPLPPAGYEALLAATSSRTDVRIFAELTAAETWLAK